MKWTETEIEFLIKNVDKGSRFCCDFLKRNQNSVRDKAKKLKLHFKKVPMSIETKNKLSISMKKSFKDGISKGWYYINTDKSRRSYPEKFFVEVFKSEFFSKFTIEEKLPYDGYFIDFLIIELKLIIEIDGNQHFTTPIAIEHDRIRDEFFIDEGFKIYRIKWLDVYKNSKKEINELMDFIGNIEKNLYRKYNIDDIIKKHICSCGNEIVHKKSKNCSSCKIFNSRKVKDRPSVEILKEEIEKDGYVNTGRKYGVSKTTIRQWIGNRKYY